MITILFLISLSIFILGILFLLVVGPRASTRTFLFTLITILAAMTVMIISGQHVNDYQAQQQGGTSKCTSTP